jgi:hypothetical protein
MALLRLRRTASARLYSLVETARANGIEPHAYLSRLFAELPKATSADCFEIPLRWNAVAIRWRRDAMAVQMPLQHHSVARSRVLHALQQLSRHTACRGIGMS